MVFTCIVLDNEENFIQFLDPNLLTINEEIEEKEIGRISVEYYMQDVTDAERLFSMGNKLWIQGRNLKSCVYVINTKIRRDFYKENKVSFEAEDKIVELNNVFFSQTELVSNNGFSLRTINNVPNVRIDHNALSYWFGDYFNVGIVQDCLSDSLQYVVVTGTMTIMQLLRYIEEETGNIFITRYEKDINSNIIHPYIDFLNPTNNFERWELNIEYTFYEEEGNDIDGPLEDETGEIIDEGTIIDEGIDVLEEDDIVEFPTYIPPTVFSPDDLQFVLKDGGNVVGLWDVTNVDLSGSLEFVFNLKYVNNTLTITINSKTYNVANEDIGGGVKGYTSVEGASSSIDDIILGNNFVFQIVDSTSGSVLYQQNIKPSLGDVHQEVLDLGFNVENIEYEIDEEDTYNAIAPILNNEGENGLTRNQLNTVISRWINLEVEKGDIIPMIVQRITSNGNMTGYDVHSKYYNRPLKPNDQDNQKEYWVATAYWAAPFDKHAGDIFIAENENSLVTYDSIVTRRDDGDLRGVGYAPKVGPVETSDEDPYAIYNDVAMKLKDKMYPKLDLEVDVANLKDHTYNEYNLYDKVYVKVPGFEQLITAMVRKTTKNPHDIAENKIELGNHNLPTKVSQTETEILASNVSFRYPSKKTIDIYLKDIFGNPLMDKLISVNLLKVENESATPTKSTYNKKTDGNGKISINAQFDPGDYQFDINFGGDIEYAPTSGTIDINVSGTKQVAQSSSSKKTTKSATTSKSKNTTKKQYYNKYGVSPSKKMIMAIGKAINPGEIEKYGSSNYYRTIFYRKCPKCGSAELYWSIFWGSKESSTSGKFPATGKKESNANKGLVICKKCGSRFSPLGNSTGIDDRKLKVYNGPYKTKKTEAYALKKGKQPYNTVKKVVKSKKVVGNSQQPKYSDVDPKVQKKARNIVGNSTGLAAAKKIAKWCGKNIKYQKPVYSGFHKSPRSVLSSRKGNCCDQTRLMLSMMNAVGVTQSYKLIYMHVHKGKKGHVFAKINGTYVDPCKTNNPWGHYVHGYGKPGSARNSVYPNKPF